MATPSETFFKRTLDQKTQEARDAVAMCIRQYLAPKPDQRHSSAKAAFEAIGRIIEMLHQTDRPDWLLQLQSRLEVATHHHSDSNGIEAVHAIASHLYPQLQRHQWHIGSEEDALGFDFDAVYERFRNESRLPDLFDEIIKCLKDLVDTDAIDSVRAIRELNNIIATLHRARIGSYFATRGAWYFVTTWFKNTGWELLSSIPVAGSAAKGLRKTLEDANKEMKSLHDKIQAELESQISADFPLLEYKQPVFPKLEDRSSLDSNKAT